MWPARDATQMFPWPAYRCERCGSVMFDNESWEEHMRSHARLDAEAAPDSGASSAAGETEA